MSGLDVNVALSVAAGWEDIDLLDADNAAMLPESLVAALRVAAGESEHMRLMMLRALVALTPTEQSVGMGLAVTLAQPPADDAPAEPPSPGSLGLAGADVSAISLAVGSGVRVRRLVEPARGLPTLQVQYALDTEHGLLTLTFTTVQGPHAEEWEPLFDAIASTCEFE